MSTIKNNTKNNYFTYEVLSKQKIRTEVIGMLTYINKTHKTRRYSVFTHLK